ncbi:EF-hand domain-containing protein [Maritimibacter sp. DP1N21-5]|uniref:EF-hand domain-containing protein n=1 Tax=Maritimibacter sp. DP1N21-5 TaxID=2836867 RepID=UPI001C48D046|nr:EF-hand domain-containing protein [Maritimibacter sp. DP1N21-5]MBV7409232.1 EF-hand domain-containing protein [Maritimibacter sp. DP1N21-5]
MKNVWKIATVGVVTGLTVSIASVTMAEARDMDRHGGGHMGRDHGMRGGMQMSFADLDENGDGSITAEDFTARAQAFFDGADADGDGSVTLSELTAANVARFDEAYEARVTRAAPGEVPGRPSDAQVTARAEKMAQHMIARGDADGNATLEGEEMQTGDRAARMIDRFDTDDDGAISKAEFDAMKARRGNGHGERMERGGERRGPGAGQGRMGNRPMPPAADAAPDTEAN